MEVNLFDVKDEHGFESNWWKHISSSNFGFQENLKDLRSHLVDEKDFLLLSQRSPEGFFEKFWFIATDMGVERTVYAEAKEVLSECLVEFVKANGKLPYSCVIAKTFKNGSIQVNYEPTNFDKVVMKLAPGEFGIEDVQEFFEGLDLTFENPVGNSPLKEIREVSASKPKKMQMFVAGQKITVHSGKIKKIQQITKVFEGEISYHYVIYLADGEYELEGDVKTEFEELLAQISEKKYETLNPQVGDDVYCKGKTKTDWKLGDIVHNIRTFKIL